MIDVLTASQLVEQAKEELRNTFGSADIPVTIPPELVLETRRVADGEGYGFLRPLYFPLGETRLDLPTPSGWKKLNPWFFKQMTGNRPNISSDVAKIGAYWTLFDESERPEFAGDEKFGLILTSGREMDNIKVPSYLKYLSMTARNGVSMKEQANFVFPELAKPLRLVDHIAQGLVVIRRPKAAEFNYAGNLRYEHLGRDSTFEGFDDVFGGDSCFVGGSYVGGGLGSIYYRWTDDHDGELVFRPLIVFLSQPQSLVTW